MEKIQQSNVIILYGTDWCPDCWRATQVLDRLGAAYEYVNIEHNEDAAELVMQLNRGFRSVPTIVFPDGDVLVEPENLDLVRKLTQNELPTN